MYGYKHNYMCNKKNSIFDKSFIEFPQWAHMHIPITKHPNRDVASNSLILTSVINRIHIERLTTSLIIFEDLRSNDRPLRN